MFLTSYQMPNKKPTTTPKMKITAPMRIITRKSFAEHAFSARRSFALDERNTTRHCTQVGSIFGTALVLCDASDRLALLSDVPQPIFLGVRIARVLQSQAPPSYGEYAAVRRHELTSRNRASTSPITRCASSRLCTCSYSPPAILILIPHCVCASERKPPGRLNSSPT